MATITINGIAFDPIAEEPKPSISPTPDALRSDYILIQTRLPLNRAQKGKLVSLGATIQGYVPRLTYRCHYAKSDLQPIRALPYVAWADFYPAGFKLAPTLLSPESATDQPRVLGLAELAAKSERTLKLDSKEVDVTLHIDVNPKDVRQKLAAAAHLDLDDLKLGRHKARMTVETRYLPDLAAIDEVRRIEEVLSPELLNDVARRIIGIGALDPETGFEGKGQIVVVADSGFDSGETDEGKVHPAFQDRVVKLYRMGRPDNGDDPIGHGTHVAGSVLGDGISDDGTVKIRGTAPKAHLIVQALYGPQGIRAGLPTDLHDLFYPPYHDDGARIHNDSWGDRPGKGQYSPSSREVDEFVWNHRDFVICFAAGNEGSDRQGTGTVAQRSITSPGTAKNCITVGATESVRNIATTYFDFFGADFPKGPIASDRMASNAEDIAAISSRGPVDNNRNKPDIVAPGTFILSTLSSRVLGSPGWKPGDSHFFFFGGTSTATPLVAGCVAIVREFLANEHDLTKPSAALVKALLINGARHMAGQVPGEFSSIPNPAEGFGRVDMVATVGPFGAHESMTFKDEATALEDDQEELTRITVNSSTSRLKVTLVWTDPPGTALQNDLDLIVKAANGQERHGNTAPDSAEFDRVNNVEQVTWTNIPEGDVDIIVRAERITMFPQTYALAIHTA